MYVAFSSADVRPELVHLDQTGGIFAQGLVSLLPAGGTRPELCEQDEEGVQAGQAATLLPIQAQHQPRQQAIQHICRDFRPFLNKNIKNGNSVTWRQFEKTYGIYIQIQ